MITAEQVKYIFQDCDFTNLTSSNYDWKVLDELSDKVKDYDWHVGATKLVIDLLDEDVIIKIPFCGQDYFTETDEITEFDPFCSANYFIDMNSSEWDYCATECCIYDLAKNFHCGELAKLFAKEWFLCEVNNHPIYLQEKCNPLAPEKISFSYADKEASKYVDKTAKSMNVWHSDEWLVLVCHSFGKELFNTLLSFVKEYSINDIHSLNFGENKNGMPCSFDYSGFNEIM